MLRRSVAPGILLVGVMIATLTLACGSPAPNPAPGMNGQEQQADEATPQDQRPPTERDPDDGYTLEVPTEQVGEHLEPTLLEVSVDLLLEASEDEIVAALPMRAKASTGKLFQPSGDSPTQESFWLHIFTDRSQQDATDWVKHLASQEPAVAGFLTPHHEVFDAVFRPAPVVGDASVWIELRHGHSNGCWRSDLLVFAQDGYVVLLKNAIEVTGETSDAGLPASGASRCENPEAPAPLTDLELIAGIISERLYLSR